MTRIIFTLGLILQIGVVPKYLRPKCVLHNTVRSQHKQGAGQPILFALRTHCNAQIVFASAVTSSAILFSSEILSASVRLVQNNGRVLSACPNQIVHRAAGAEGGRRNARDPCLQQLSLQSDEKEERRVSHPHVHVDQGKGQGKAQAHAREVERTRQGHQGRNHRRAT